MATLWVKKSGDGKPVQTKLWGDKVNCLEIACGFGFDLDPRSLLLDEQPVITDDKLGISTEPATRYQGLDFTRGTSPELALVVSESPHAQPHNFNRDVFNFTQMLLGDISVSNIQLKFEGKVVSKELVSLPRGVSIFGSVKEDTQFIVNDDYRTIAEHARKLVAERTHHKNGLLVTSSIDKGSFRGRLGIYLWHKLKEWFPEKSMVFDFEYFWSLRLSPDGFELSTKGGFNSWGKDILISQDNEMPSLAGTGTIIVNTVENLNDHDFRRLVVKCPIPFESEKLGEYSHEELVLLRYYLVSRELQYFTFTNPVKDMDVEVVSDPSFKSLPEFYCDDTAQPPTSLNLKGVYDDSWLWNIPAMPRREYFEGTSYACSIDC